MLHGIVSSVLFPLWPASVDCVGRGRAVRQIRRDLRAAVRLLLNRHAWYPRGGYVRAHGWSEADSLRELSRVCLQCDSLRCAGSQVLLLLLK